MRIRSILFLLGMVAAGVTFYLHRRRPAASPTMNLSSPLTTVTPTKQTIRHTVATTGRLQIKDSSRIGSLVAGTVKQILVRENDVVKKGQLLAVLDNGKGDTAVRSAEGLLLRAQAQFDYLDRVYQRQQALFDEGHISAQEYEEAERAWRVSKGDLLSAEASRDVAAIELANTEVRAPEDGIIIAVGIKKGIRVTTDLNATVLFETAKDVTQMEADLEIDEGDVCHIRKGHKVNFTVDSYPGRIFKGRLTDISFSPTHNGTDMVYKAQLDVDNSRLLLRPGMTIHATVKVAKAKDTLSLATQALYMEAEEVKAAASHLGYTCAEIPSKEKKALCKACDQEATDLRYVWTVENQKLVEKAIKIAARDNQRVEVRDGIGDGDQCLIDIVQDDAMKKHYKNIFKGSL